VSRTTIADNSAGNGGGSFRGTPGAGADAGGMLIVFAGAGGPTIRTSAITGNSAGNGGSSNFAANGGAGGWAGGLLVMPNVSATFSNATIAVNSSGGGGSSSFGDGGASGSGGGLYLPPGSNTSFTHVTIAANQIGAPGGGTNAGAQGNGGGIYAQGTASLANSIIASNVPGNCVVTSPSAASNGGHNVLFGANGGPPCPMPVTGDPLLGPLANNGGPTKTMALGEGSSAIDIVPLDSCLAVDQRGILRPQRTACDAGAFELEPPPPPATDTSGGGGTPTGGDQQQTPLPSAAPDRTPPTVKLLLTKQKLLKALKKGYFAFFSDNEIGNATADLFASGKDAKGTAARRKRVAHGTLKVTKTGKQKLVVKFTKKAKKAFKTRKKVTLTLVLTVKDAAGNATKKTAKIVLKR
jgi:hypothetical protein